MKRRPGGHGSAGGALFPKGAWYAMAPGKTIAALVVTAVLTLPAGAEAHSGVAAHTRRGEPGWAPAPARAVCRAALQGVVGAGCPPPATLGEPRGGAPVRRLPPPGAAVIPAAQGKPVPRSWRQPVWPDRGYAVPLGACPVFAGRVLEALRYCPARVARQLRRTAEMRQELQIGALLSAAVWVIVGLAAAVDWRVRRGTAHRAQGGGRRHGLLAG